MTTLDWALTVQVMAAGGAVVGVLFVVVLTHALHAGLRARKDRARLDRVHGLLATALEWADAGSGVALRAALRVLPSRLWVPLLEEVDPGLDGERRQRLGRVMAQLGVTERAERWCGSRRWPRRLRGLRLLTLLRAGHTVAPRLLHDARPEVRALAMEWAAENPTDDLVEQLLGLLATDAEENSFPVKDALSRMGPPAVGPLSRFLEREHGPALEAGLHVAVVLNDPRMLPAALTASRDPRPAVRALAATLAGALGGGPAVDRLTQLLQDADPGVRAAALGALARLEYWPAAAQVALLLRDPAWPVRSEAGLALRALGPTGTLLLRRALDDEHQLAREVARHVLDLPLGHQMAVPA